MIGRLGRDDNKRTVTFYGEPAGRLPASLLQMVPRKGQARYARTYGCLPAACLPAQGDDGCRIWPRAWPAECPVQLGGLQMPQLGLLWQPDWQQH